MSLGAWFQKSRSPLLQVCWEEILKLASGNQLGTSTVLIHIGETITCSIPQMLIRPIRVWLGFNVIALYGPLSGKATVPQLNSALGTAPLT